MMKPIYPLTDEQEQELIDFDEAYANQYDLLAEWEHEVALCGYATFPRPIIEPLSYSDKLQHWIDLCKQYNVDLAKWEAESTDKSDLVECDF